MAPGADEGTGITSGGLPAAGVETATLDQTTDVAADDLPLTPEAERKKTRYSDRAPIEDKARGDADSTQERAPERRTGGEPASAGASSDGTRGRAARLGSSARAVDFASGGAYRDS